MDRNVSSRKSPLNHNTYTHLADKANVERHINTGPCGNISMCSCTSFTHEQLSFVTCFNWVIMQSFCCQVTVSLNSVCVIDSNHTLTHRVTWGDLLQGFIVFSLYSVLVQALWANQWQAWWKNQTNARSNSSVTFYVFVFFFLLLHTAI